MNSHIVEKTMHSIKNIDRLTDLAAIDVYNTTHDTINKYEIMKEHATEEYTNESFYQESVLAGVLIGAGVLGVAISAFFIIKKIIDSKDSADSSVKSADGKMVAAQVDLTDPKSTEKYLSDLSDRLKKLTETKSIKVTKSINKEEFESAEKQIKDWSDKLQNIIDNKHEATAIEQIIDEISISSVDASKIFVDKEMNADVATFAEALGLKSISSFAALLTQLKKQIDDVEKMVNNKKDKEAENAVEISQDHLTKLKNQNNAAAKLIATLKAKSKETLGETDKAVLGAINAETEAKKKDEEAKTAEKSADTEAAKEKAETDESKPEAKPTDDAASGAGGGDNTGKKSSTLENVMGPGGQTEQMQQASDAKKAAEVQNKNPMHIPEGSNDKANAQTLDEIINMLKSGKSDEDVMNRLKLNNYSDDQIKDFLAKAKETVNGPKNEIIQALTVKGKSPTIAQNIANEICDKYNNDLVQYMNAQIAANPGDDKSATWVKNEAYKNCMIIADAIGVDKTSIPKPDESVSEPPKSEEEIKTPEEPEKKPEDQVKTEPENPLTAENTQDNSDNLNSNSTYPFAVKTHAEISELIDKGVNEGYDQTALLAMYLDLNNYDVDSIKFNRIKGTLNSWKDNPDEYAKICETCDWALQNFTQNKPTMADIPELKDLVSAKSEQPKQISPEYQQINDEMMKDLLKTNPFISDSDETSGEKKPEDQVKTEPVNPPTPETSTEEPETKPEGENSPATEGSENTTEDTNGVPYNVLSAEYLQSLLNMPEQSAIEAIKNIKDEDIEQMAIGIPKNIFVQLFENAASALATVSPATYLQQLTDMLNNNAAVNKIKALLYQIKQGDRTAFPKLKTINFKELAELTDGRDVSDYITSILPRVKSAFDSLVAKYEPAVLDKKSKVWGYIANIEQNAAAFFNKIKEACEGLSNKDKALAKVNELEAVVEGKMHHLDPNYSGKIEGLPNNGSNGKSITIGGHTPNGQVSGSIGKVPEDEIERQQRQVESLLNNKIQAPAQFNPSAPADWNDRMNELGKAGIPNKQVPEPKTAPTPLNPTAPTEWNDKMNALKSAGAENISQKTEVPPIAPIDTNADIAKAKAEKAQLDALQQHRQEQLAQLKAERAQREQQVRDAYAQDAQVRQNAVNEELAKQSQEDEQKKAQANELTKANEEAAAKESEANALDEARNIENQKAEANDLKPSVAIDENMDNKIMQKAIADFNANYRNAAWRDAHPGINSAMALYESEDYRNEAAMEIEAERIKNEKLADNRAGIQFIKEQNYEAIVPSLNKVLDTTPDFKTIGRYLDGLKTAYAKILMQYQQNPGNARKIIEDYSKNGAAPYEFYTVPYNELNQTQLIDWQQRLFGAKVELDKDRRRNRKKIKAVDKIIDKLIELDELLKTSVHNVIATATKNPMRALEAALVMFQEGDEEIIAGLTAIENFINKADEVKASEEEADNTPENPAEEPSDEEVSQSILSILKS